MAIFALLAYVAEAFPVGSNLAPANSSSSGETPSTDTIFESTNTEVDLKAIPFKEPGTIKLIVLDPGHGGKDYGAIGASGLNEKDVTLKVAKELQISLRRALGAKVLLTRDTDTYLTLSERTTFANKEKADIFISIHANASTRRAAKGIETYFLSYEASDNEARKVAAFENEVVKLEGKTHGAPTSEIEAILWDLTKSNAHHESSRLAESIHNPLVKALRGENRGVKQAPFYVLMGATMPAILLEVGFISNRKEERALARKKTHAKIADAVTDGMLRFEEVLNKASGLVKLK
ncbi:MAG: N-acetylmuramoyl-L-alanine amidase [Deltaproteobacteria bacterium]|nr:N-acetylmuramoyl-L-alanine amidase [Deltaproteobacteria bacterium]